MPLDKRSNTTFPELRRAALDLMRAGGVPGLAAATIPSGLADLKHGLVWQVNRHLALECENEARYRLDPPTHAPVSPLNVQEYLSGTAAAAASRARSRGMRRPGNSSSRVRRLLEALSGSTVRAGVAVPVPLPSAWHALAGDALAHGATGRDQAKWRSIATGIRNLARVATAHGVIDPACLPATYDSLVAVLRAWERPRIAHDVWVLRQARRASVRPIRLPIWDARATQRAERSSREALMSVFFADIADWSLLAQDKVGNRSPAERERSAHEPLRPATRARYEWQARQWAAGACALSERGLLTPEISLAHLDLSSIWTITMTHGAASTVTREVDARMHARRTRLGRTHNDATTDGKARPLAVVVAERCVDQGDIWPDAVRVAGVLPPSITQALFALFAMAERLEIATSGDDSPEVTVLRELWKPELPALKEQLDRAAGRVKDTARLLRGITLPQLVCCVLPWRTLVDLPRRKRDAVAAGQAASHAHASHSTRAHAVRCERAWREALQRWMVQAVFTAEPMRKRNLMHARVGTEILLDATWHPDGSLEKLRGIASRFPERDGSDVSETETKTGEERTLWHWSPAIVATTWAETYLKEVWLPAARQLVSGDATASMRDLAMRGTVAFLINPDPRHQDCGTVAGAYRGDGVAVRFAEALLEGMRVLGREELPASVTEAKQTWPWLFGPHVVRSLWASYWWGARGDNGPVRKRRDGGLDRESGKVVARRATCDVDRTLKAHYVRGQAAMIERSRMDPTSFDHPRAFDGEMDQTWWIDATVDWAARWRDARFPLPERLRRLFADSARELGPTRLPRTRRRGARSAPPPPKADRVPMPPVR